MSGETLRAVLDRSCTDNRLSMWQMETTFAGAATAQTLQLQAKKDCYFLVTQVCPYVIALGLLVEPPLGVVRFREADSSDAYANDLTLGRMLGGDAHHAFTMPQYWMIDPAQTMLFAIDPTGLPVNATVGVQLFGIEYRR